MHHHPVPCDWWCASYIAHIHARSSILFCRRNPLRSVSIILCRGMICRRGRFCLHVCSTNKKDNGFCSSRFAEVLLALRSIHTRTILGGQWTVSCDQSKSFSAIFTYLLIFRRLSCDNSCMCSLSCREDWVCAFPNVSECWIEWSSCVSHNASARWM